MYNIQLILFSTDLQKCLKLWWLLCADEPRTLLLNTVVTLAWGYEVL